MTPVSTQTPGPRTHTPCSSHVVARLLLRDVTDEKSGNCKMDRSCHRPANLCPGQCPGAPHSTGPTAGPRHPASRPKIKLCLFEIRPHHGTDWKPFLWYPFCPWDPVIKMRRPLYIVMGVTSACVPRPPPSTEGEETTQDPTRSAAPRTRTTTPEQLVTRDPTDTHVMTHSVN